MKEITNRKLANPSQTPYSKGVPRFDRGGDIFMEGKPDMTPANAKPANPEHAERIPAQNTPQIRGGLTPEAFEAVWENYLGTREAQGKIPSDEMQTLKIMRESGIPPIGGATQQPGEPTAEAGGTAQSGEQEIPPTTPPTGISPKDQGSGLSEDVVDREGSERQALLDHLGDIESRIADARLRNEISAIKSSLNAGLPLEQTLSEALQRIALLETSYGSVQEQEQRSQQKQILLGDVQNLTKSVVDNIVRGRLTARHEGMYGERKLTEEEKELIRRARKPEGIEELFNRMFDTVDSLPQVDFDTGFGSIGTFEYAEFLKVLNEEISEQNKGKHFERARELGDIRAQFTKEKSARTIIHNAYFAVISGQNTEAVSNYMSQFLNGYADIAFGKAGVVQAMHFYEQALLIIREENGGYLPSKQVIGELGKNNPGQVNALTEKLLNDANSEGKLAVDENGNLKQLTKWELDRALSFARGMSVVTGRSIEIAATSILPGTESGSSAFIDLFAQKIIQELYPFRHGGVKFQTSKDNKVTRVLAYLLDSKRTPWTPKQIQAFDQMGLEDQIKVLNDLMPEGEERFFSVLNPLEIGGWLSRTGWRIGGNVVTPGESAIKKMLQDGEGEWIGTGVILERERGGLEKLESRDFKTRREGQLAKRKIEEALKKTARVTPLRFFLNVRDFKEQVIADILKEDNNYFEDNGAKKKSLILEINRRFEEAERIRIEEGKKEEKLLGEDPKKKKEMSKEEKEKDDKRRNELRKKIEMEVVMSDSEFDKDIRDLVMLQDQAVSKQDDKFLGKINENGEMIEGKSRLGTMLHNKFLHGVADFVESRKEAYGETHMERFLRKLEHKSWKTPFVFGTEDIPFNKYVFEETGPRGAARRWADMTAAAKAGTAFSEFLSGIDHYTEQGQIVEMMAKIYPHIKDYNLEFAEKFMEELAEGVMKFYGKKWTHRLPLGMGSAASFLEGNSSYAQIAFGKGKMAWDEMQQNEFTRLLRDKGLIKVEQQHKLQKKAGGGKKEVVWGYTRTVLPLIMMALAYYIITKAAKEERP